MNVCAVSVTAHRVSDTDCDSDTRRDTVTDSQLGDSMSNQSLLALFRTTHLRFCSNFTCLFTSMIEATVPNFRKNGQVFLEKRPPEKLKFYPKNCLTATSRQSLTNNSGNNLARNLNDTFFRKVS